MNASPASLLSLPPPRRWVIRGEYAPAGIFFVLAGRDVIVYCKIQKIGALFSFERHSYKKFCEIVALNYSFVHTPCRISLPTLATFLGTISLSFPTN
jgi:hypothetical protein